MSAGNPLEWCVRTEVLGGYLVRTFDEIVTRKSVADKPLTPKNGVHTLQ